MYIARYFEGHLGFRLLIVFLNPTRRKFIFPFSM
jgi:hypothetical protein